MAQHLHPHLHLRPQLHLHPRSKGLQQLRLSSSDSSRSQHSKLLWEAGAWGLCRQCPAMVLQVHMGLLGLLHGDQFQQPLSRTAQRRRHRNRRWRLHQLLRVCVHMRCQHLMAALLVAALHRCPAARLSQCLALKRAMRRPRLRHHCGGPDSSTGLSRH